MICSDTFAVGCIVWPQYTSSQRDRPADESIAAKNQRGREVA